jgi:hypothetical protein
MWHRRLRTFQVVPGRGRITSAPEKYRTARAPQLNSPLRLLSAISPARRSSYNAATHLSRLRLAAESKIDTVCVEHEISDGEDRMSRRRNVTLALDESTARWARIEAARQDTSLSEFLGSLLRERMRQDRAYEHSMAEYLAAGPRPLKAEREGYPQREALHDRADLR